MLEFLPPSLVVDLAMATMNIFIKKVGEEKEAVTVNLSDTLGELKSKAQLSPNITLRLRQQVIRKGQTLVDCGVKDGDMLSVFANNVGVKGFSSLTAYQAKRRVDKGLTKRSTAHRSLHQETQAVVLAESALSQATTKKVGEEIKEEVKQGV